MKQYKKGFVKFFSLTKQKLLKSIPIVETVVMLKATASQNPQVLLPEYEVSPALKASCN